MRAKSFMSRGIAVLAVTAATLVGLSGTSSAEPVQRIRNVGSGNGCMDISSTASGTPVTLFGCGGVLSQRWDTPGNSTIRNYLTGECMDVGSYSRGAVVHMRPCNDSLLSQKWGVYQDTIYALGSINLCMDLRSYNNGTPVILETCGSQLSQQWKPA
jgi:hypothetical protein